VICWSVGSVTSYSTSDLGYEIVPKVCLDFDFTTKLVLDGGFEQLSLLDYLRLQSILEKLTP
jgi:hypothetical protein